MYIFCLQMFCNTIVRMGKKKPALSAGSAGSATKFLIPVSESKSQQSVPQFPTLPYMISQQPQQPQQPQQQQQQQQPNSGAPPPPPNPAMPMPMPPPNMQLGGFDTISQTILNMNSNPYIIGIFMLFLNLGGRFLALELSKKQEEFLSQSWIRPMLFFTVIFIATRNLVVAFWVTMLFFFIIWVVANENSPYCLIPSWCGHNTESEKVNYEKNVKKIV